MNEIKSSDLKVVSGAGPNDGLQEFLDRMNRERGPYGPLPVGYDV